MKIVILCTFYQNMFENPSILKAGDEAVIRNHIEVFSEFGEDLHIIHTGEVHEDYSKLATFYSVGDECYDDVDKEIKNKIYRKYNEKAEGIIYQVNPDILFNHAHLPSVAAKLSKNFKVFHMIHQPATSFFTAVPLIKKFEKIISNNGIIYGTESSENISKRNYEQFSTRKSISYTDKKILETYASKNLYSIYSTSFMSLHKNWLDAEIKNSNGGLISVGRLTKDDIKNLRLIEKLEIDIDLYTSFSGAHKNVNLLKKIEASKHINLHFDEKRDVIRDAISNSSCVLFACEESSPVVAVEALSCGSIPIVLVKKQGDRHGSQRYAEKVTDLCPAPISMQDENLRGKILEAVEYCNSISFEERTKIALAARKLFSPESVHSEYIELFKSIKSNKEVALDLM